MNASTTIVNQCEVKSSKGNQDKIDKKYTSNLEYYINIYTESLIRCEKDINGRIHEMEGYISDLCPTQAAQVDMEKIEALFDIERILLENLRCSQSIALERISEARTLACRELEIRIRTLYRELKMKYELLNQREQARVWPFSFMNKKHIDNMKNEIAEAEDEIKEIENSLSKLKHGETELDIRNRYKVLIENLCQIYTELRGAYFREERRRKEILEAEKRRQRELAEAAHRREVDETARKFDDVVIRTRNNAMERMHIFRDLIDYTVQLFVQAIAAKSAKKYEKEIECEFSYEVLSDKIEYEFDCRKNSGKKEEKDDSYSFKEHRKAELSTAEERLGFAWALAVLVSNRMQEMQPQCTIGIERREPTDEQKWAKYKIYNRVTLKYSCSNPEYEAEESMI